MFLHKVTFSVPFIFFFKLLYYEQYSLFQLFEFITLVNIFLLTFYLYFILFIVNNYWFLNFIIIDETKNHELFLVNV